MQRPSRRHDPVVFQGREDVVASRNLVMGERVERHEVGEVAGPNHIGSFSPW